MLPKGQQKLTKFSDLVEEGLSYLQLFLELPESSWSHWNITFVWKTPKTVVLCLLPWTNLTFGLIYNQFEKIISVVGQKPWSISVRKSIPLRYQQERISGPNDKNEKCLGSDSEMNKIYKNSYWRTLRLVSWFWSYLWAYNPGKLFVKKIVLLKNAWRNIFEPGISVRTPPT